MIDDPEIDKRISAGDAKAFDTWYRETAPRLRAFLRHLTGSDHASDDLVQETYTQIWRRPQAFNPERGNARAWLYGIARKRAAEWWRGQRPCDPLSEEQSAPSPAEGRAILAEALDRLSLDHRTLLWLREVEGQSYAELAVILDVPIGTVRSRLFDAREALRAVWRGEPRAAASSKGGRA